MFDDAIESFDMTYFSKILSVLLSAGALLVLSACATGIEEPVELIEMTPEEAAADAASTLTGSRIPRKSSERLLRITGAAGGKEMMSTGRPPEPGPLNGN